jgi:hypothetical protein
MPCTDLSQMNPDAIKLFILYYELADFKAIAARIEWTQKMKSVCPREWIQKNESILDTLAKKLYVKKFREELTNLLSENFPHGSIGSTRFDNWLRKFFTEQKEQYDEGLITMDELMFAIFEKTKEESRINMK